MFGILWNGGGKDNNGQREKSVAQKVSACPVMAGATGTLRSEEKEAGVRPNAGPSMMLPANFCHDFMCDFPVWLPAVLGSSGPIVTAHNVDRS